MEIDQKIDVQEESKVLRHFPSDLIDFVKESLKPTWREAAVESIKQFLSSSQPKMTKLAEGYVSKYGKS
ncbi:hypothetical protein NC653_010574 [Populus alba x Populus x berolinensis]|uniref:Uncharacterized protein n=1 Tax=Populus alba x Populus x berolinensis TaxID=444605 RepID=A0AAD6R080_9ROSI|nr:hypothetical protein NC653_010574 [Populus alba x Populus x berolinensis]